jgi:hypothetical protein
MSSAPTLHRISRPLWARLAGLVCLLAWFAATPSLLPSAVAVLGYLDGQHRVTFAERDGRVAVVLRHENGAPPRAHYHSPVAAVLTVLAQCSTPSQDHVLTFARTDDAGLTLLAVPPSAMSVDLARATERFVPLPLPQTAKVSGFAPRPPPTSAFALVCLRSTSLLV